ncbi:MAG TPA: DUF3253 domain-containing protein [Trichocoleus sp.]
MAITSQQVRLVLLAQVQARGAGKTICPSEVARALAGESWRDLMPLVRSVGANLTAEGKIITLQKGQVVDSKQVRGPIRYSQLGGSSNPNSPDH